MTNNVIPEGKETFQELDSSSEVKILIIKLYKLYEWSESPHIGAKEYTAFSRLFEEGLRDLSRSLAQYLKEVDNQVE